METKKNRMGMVLLLKEIQLALHLWVFADSWDQVEVVLNFFFVTVSELF